MNGEVWRQLVARAVAEFVGNGWTAERLIQRLKGSGSWEMILAQFRGGATSRVVLQLLRRALMEIVGRMDGRMNADGDA